MCHEREPSGNLRISFHTVHVRRDRAPMTNREPRPAEGFSGLGGLGIRV